MNTSITYSAIPSGFTATPVIIECTTSRGLNAFSIIGMANKTIEESRERIRFALKNSGFTFPTDHLTVNLAPASLQKTGSYLDLPIAAAILAHSGQLLAEDIRNTAFVGELALNGKIRPIRGILNIVERLSTEKIKRIIIPAKNYAQAEFLKPNIELIPANNLREVWLYLTRNIKPRLIHQPVVKNTQTDTNILLDSIIGQTEAKRALTIAVAGRHNILLYGPPGTGKSMLAQTVPNLLPPPTNAEVIAITKLHSLVNDNQAIHASRPFRSPHHSASRTALLGGTNGLPGEISLAHNGVLYLDELPEFPRDFLESLRQPIEQKSITISRANQSITYPADFMLVATMNPCPCGNFGSKQAECTCKLSNIQRYRNKLSGPLLDRVDMRIQLPRPSTPILVKNTTTSTREHQTAKEQIVAAMHRQIRRQNKYNSNLDSSEITAHCRLSKTAETYLERAANRYKLSVRSYFKLIKVAQTIADLSGSPLIIEDFVAEAIHFRDIF